MSKILITGNGFDLFHHLPTKYGHFMAIMETIEKYDFKKEVTFEDLFERFFKERFPRDYKSIEDNYFIEKILFEREKTLEISELIKKNSWYNHFKNISNIETWIDFETEIEKALFDFSLLFEYSKSHPNRYDNFNMITVKVYNDYFHFRLTEEKSDSYFYFNKNYLDERNKKIKEKEFLNDVIKSLEDFIKIFNQYLIDILSNFYEKRKNEYNFPFNLLDDIYTVNYTPTLELIYNVDNAKIKYLHGKINDNNDLQNIVLGISEIPENIKHSKIFNFSKYFQRIYKNTNYNIFNDIINVKDLSKNSYYNEIIQFVMIGHSLDKSDKYLLEKIFNILRTDSTKRAFLTIFYYNEDDKLNKLNNLFSIFDKELIVDLNSENRLNFIELNDLNLTFELSKDIKGSKLLL